MRQENEPNCGTPAGDRDGLPREIFWLLCIQNLTHEFKSPIHVRVNSTRHVP
jgi:hypothetical protein